MIDAALKDAKSSAGRAVAEAKAAVENVKKASSSSNSNSSNNSRGGGDDGKKDE